jgi:hypothetical protein
LPAGVITFSWQYLILNSSFNIPIKDSFFWVKWIKEFELKGIGVIIADSGVKYHQLLFFVKQ